MDLLLSLDVCGHVWEHRKDDSAACREAYSKRLWIVGGKRRGIPPGAESVPELFACNFRQNAKKSSEILTISELSHGVCDQ